MIKIKYYLILFLLISLNSASAIDKMTIPQLISGWYFPSINNSVSRTDFHIALDIWMQEFTQNLDVEHTEVRLFDSVEEMLFSYNNGELSFILAPPLVLAKYFKLDSLADGFKSINQPGQPGGMAIIARKDKNIWQTSDLKNKRLSMQNNDELADVFLDTLIIPEFDQTYHQVFNSVEYMQKQNAIIHSLFFDQADVGVVHLETFELMNQLNPQIKNKIKILEKFPSHSLYYSFFHYQFPEKQRKIIIKEALNLNNSERAKEIFRNFRMVAIEMCPVESLNPFIRLNNKYNQLKKRLKE